jgi:hypothetical protein
MFAAHERKGARREVEFRKLDGRRMALPAAVLKDRLDVGGKRDLTVRGGYRASEEE